MSVLVLVGILVCGCEFLCNVTVNPFYDNTPQVLTNYNVYQTGCVLTGCLNHWAPM